MDLQRITKPYTLCVGDIVIGEEYIFHDETDEEEYRYHPLRIDGVSENCNIDVDGNGCMYSGSWLDDCDSESISDIYYMPISTSLLNKNFPYSEDLNRWEVGELNDVRFGRSGKNGYIIMRNDGFAECTMYCASVNKSTVRQYVHEMQRDLRDVGLSADIKVDLNHKHEWEKYNYKQ